MDALLTILSNPTVRPKEPYGPAEVERDAATLRKAMKGFGTDEKAIIAILANRSNDQRQLICKKFSSMYGKELIKDLKSELSGRFEDTVIACMTPLIQFYATDLHDAMEGLGTNDETLYDILCSQDNATINAIKSAYRSKYNTTLEADIEGDTSGYFERLLLSLCQANRDENSTVDPSRVAADVQALYNAGENKVGTDETVFTSILANRSLPHLREVFKEYQNTHLTAFEQVIKSEFSGSIEKALLAIVKNATNPLSYYAERLYKSMEGLGTNDRALIRLIVTRSEIDLQDIKVEFERKYGKTVVGYIEGDCSGDYKKMLIALVLSNQGH